MPHLLDALFVGACMGSKPVPREPHPASWAWPTGLALLASIGLATSCSSAVPRALAPTGSRPSTAVEATGRIPAAAFFRNPLLSHVRLSPDGTHIAAIHARDGVQTLVVRASHGGEVRPLAKLDREGMRGPDAGLGQQRASHGELRDAEYLPTVVSTHGGPWSRDVWGYRPDVQYLASRGFAVFQLNFRGSTGYGTRHERLGYRKWGLEMQDDITDGLRWLIAQGIVDPNRIGIYGASYGGYAALMGLAKTPELFRAGASLRA